MALNTMQDLLLDELMDLYDAEHQIVKALPKMAQKASSPALKAAFELHLGQTKGQVERLEKVFELLGATAKRKTCKATEGLVEEGSELMSEKADSSVMDAGLIAAAQKVEHYEMAGYGCVRTWAQHLGRQDVAQLLQQTLVEEEQTDEKLTQIAEGMVNPQATDAQSGS